ncbi:MAG: hypothetical protein CPDRYMAC_4403 [uncultured Paraburkholderia sp.]|nr:MAG: hypothetical protein CPDRYDRY_4225 [uncultured Paraburkholderia sp.]CAH2936442.1 MAG: hypothetical protein CPDRYMAC_4403 [uncultured Paraburkholderia sp.]
MVGYPYQLKLTDRGETVPVFTTAAQPVQLHLAGSGEMPPSETWHLVGGVTIFFQMT